MKCRDKPGKSLKSHFGYCRLSNLRQGNAVIGAVLAHHFGCHTRDLLELGREMRQRAIPQHVGDLARGLLVVTQQLLGIFDTVHDGIPLKGNTLHLAE